MASRFQPLLLTALAASVLAACAPQSSSTDSAAAASAAAPAGGIETHGSPLAAMSAGDALAAQLTESRSGKAIAAYPDRGDLVGYDRVRTPQRNGGNTFHPVEVSEEHALASIGSGTLVLTGPDGRQVRMEYARHVEHPSGDWSWIGRDENGIDGILTFGEKAVFGVMPYGEDETLRLTTNNGQVYMATSTKGVLSPLQQRTRDGIAPPDYLVPSGDISAMATEALDVEAAATSAIAAAAAAAPVQRAADAANTIDLLLGYTPGFASLHGGASQAQTRLNHIVTVGNQTFANSALDMEIRLVHTMQVNYADTGSNETTLEQLTGSNGSSSVSIPASLRPLRDARETHGADLVSLVRRFRDADHEGCGIAWLIGGAQTPIVQGHEMFGYSVISDSNGMQAPDNGHYCRDETLVHELGHNLGSQHDDEAARGGDGNLDPGDYGRYPFSFGLKTNSGNGNFYTVMAYGDAGQSAWRVFSNPQITFCGGRACGVANQSDNARSLRQTAPLIAAFRASIGGGRIRADFNGDGVSDLLWRNHSDGRNTIWRSGNSATPQSVSSVTPNGWQVVGEGDFNADGVADIVWRHSGTGRNTIWRGGNGNSTISVATVAKQSWRVVGVGDFNGDGVSDLLWRDSQDGRNAIWLAGNSATQQNIISLADRAWQVAGVGDFDADGRDDIVWHHASTGRNVIWRAGNGNSTIAMSTVADTRWRVGAVDDFNGDGRADVVWRHSTTGRNSLWLTGNSATQQSISDVGLAWKIEGSGDFNGDGIADLVWRKNDGSNTIWRSANSANTMSISKVAAQAWDIVP